MNKKRIILYSLLAFTATLAYGQSRKVIEGSKVVITGTDSQPMSAIGSDSDPVTNGTSLLRLSNSNTGAGAHSVLDFLTTETAGSNRRARLITELDGTNGGRFTIQVRDSNGSTFNTALVARNDGTTTVGGLTTVAAWTSSGSDCTASPCTIELNYGGGISTITRTSTGNYAVNFTSSFWSAAPVCHLVATRGGSHFCEFNVSSVSLTSLAISCWTHAGIQQDTRLAVTCTGPRSN